MCSWFVRHTPEIIWPIGYSNYINAEIRGFLRGINEYWEMQVLSAIREHFDG
jgi:hypothetical protein